MLCLIIKYMARQSRQLSSSGVYRTILRGINQQRIFEEDSDCQAFLNCMDSVIKKSGCGFFAYCFIGMHNNSVSIRQIARVTGLSKGVVERWRHNC